MIEVDVLNEQNAYINFLELKANIVYPKGAAEQIALDQTAPGHYSGAFLADAAGRYFVTAYGGQEDLALSPATSGLIVPYSREFTDFGANLDLLERLAEMTGGKIIQLERESTGEILFAKSSEESPIYRDPWSLPTVLDLVVFIVGIAVRRLRFPKLHS